MKKSNFTDQQIAFALKQSESRTAGLDLPGIVLHPTVC